MKIGSGASFVSQLLLWIMLVPSSRGDSGPDLVVDHDYLNALISVDTIDVYQSDCYVEEGCVNGLGQRKILRFGTMIGNIGDGPLILGRPGRGGLGSDDWEWDACHQHWHFEDYAEYKLMSPIDTSITLGRKYGWCVIDLTEYQNSGAPCDVFDCEFQGISPGCADVYVPSIGCQWIDITGVPDGSYVLEVTTNPNHTLSEQDYSNNSATADLILEGNLARVVPDFVEFYHRPGSDTEDTTGPYPVSLQAVIHPGNQLDPGTAMAVSGPDGDFSDTTYLSPDGESHEFHGLMPGPGKDADFTYFFLVQDTSGSWLRDPVDSFYSFHAGPDTVPPRVLFVSQVEDTSARSGTVQVRSVVVDNIAVAETSLEYAIATETSQTFHSVPMFRDGSEWKGSMSWEDVPWFTVITYRVTATDSTSQKNTVSSESRSFQIVNWQPLAEWDSGNISGWDLGKGWGLMSLGARGMVMNDSPGTTYQNNVENVLAKVDPIDVSLLALAHLSFWHLSFMEDGRDSGYVELSTDGTEWTTVSSITGVRLQRDESIDLSPFMETGEIWLRFRMTADSQNVNLGWFIDDLFMMTDTSLGVEPTPDPLSVPRYFSLFQPYPNPFNPTTTIELSVPLSGLVTLTVYDLLGREVETILNKPMDAGRHKVKWNAGNVPSGIYFIRMESGDFSGARKVMVLR